MSSRTASAHRGEGGGGGSSKARRRRQEERERRRERKDARRRCRPPLDATAKRAASQGAEPATHSSRAHSSIVALQRRGRRRAGWRGRPPRGPLGNYALGPPRRRRRNHRRLHEDGRSDTSRRSPEQLAGRRTRGARGAQGAGGHRWDSRTPRTAKRTHPRHGGRPGGTARISAATLWLSSGYCRVQLARRFEGPPYNVPWW